MRAKVNQEKSRVGWRSVKTAIIIKIGRVKDTQIKHDFSDGFVEGLWNWG